MDLPRPSTHEHRQLQHWSPFAPAPVFKPLLPQRSVSSDLDTLEALLHIYLALPPGVSPPLPKSFRNRRLNKLCWSVYQIALRASGAERHPLDDGLGDVQPSSPESSGDNSLATVDLFHAKHKVRVPWHTLSMSLLTTLPRASRTYLLSLTRRPVKQAERYACGLIRLELSLNDRFSEQGSLARSGETAVCRV